MFAVCSNWQDLIPQKRTNVVFLLVQMKFIAEKNMDMLQEEMWGWGGAREEGSSFQREWLPFT